jgi:hypothetical protein
MLCLLVKGVPVRSKKKNLTFFNFQDDRAHFFSEEEQHQVNHVKERVKVHLERERHFVHDELDGDYWKIKNNDRAQRRLKRNQNKGVIDDTMTDFAPCTDNAPLDDSIYQFDEDSDGDTSKSVRRYHPGSTRPISRQNHNGTQRKNNTSRRRRIDEVVNTLKRSTSRPAAIYPSRLEITDSETAKKKRKPNRSSRDVPENGHGQKRRLRHIEDTVTVSPHNLSSGAKSNGATIDPRIPAIRKICQLPSGHLLSYLQPAKIEGVVTFFGEELSTLTPRLNNLDLLFNTLLHRANTILLIDSRSEEEKTRMQCISFLDFIETISSTHSGIVVANHLGLYAKSYSSTRAFIFLTSVSSTSNGKRKGELLLDICKT